MNYLIEQKDAFFNNVIKHINDIADLNDDHLIIHLKNDYLPTNLENTSNGFSFKYCWRDFIYLSEINRDRKTITMKLYQDYIDFDNSKSNRLYYIDGFDIIIQYYNKQVYFGFENTDLSRTDSVLRLPNQATIQNMSYQDLFAIIYYKMLSSYPYPRPNR